MINDWQIKGEWESKSNLIRFWQVLAGKYGMSLMGLAVPQPSQISHRHGGHTAPANLLISSQDRDKAREPQTFGGQFLNLSGAAMTKLPGW